MICGEDIRRSGAGSPVRWPKCLSRQLCSKGLAVRVVATMQHTQSASPKFSCAAQRRQSSNPTPTRPRLTPATTAASTPTRRLPQRTPGQNVVQARPAGSLLTYRPRKGTYEYERAASSAICILDRIRDAVGFLRSSCLRSRSLTISLTSLNRTRLREFKENVLLLRSRSRASVFRTN